MCVCVCVCEYVCVCACVCICVCVCECVCLCVCVHVFVAVTQRVIHVVKHWQVYYNNMCMQLLKCSVCICVYDVLYLTVQ